MISCIKFYPWDILNEFLKKYIIKVKGIYIYAYIWKSNDLMIYNSVVQWKTFIYLASPGMPCAYINMLD